VKLVVNGVEQEIAAETLAAALDKLDYGEARVATALNGAFVPARKRGETALRDGDRVEIVAPRQGG
jgi:sulfur carrier protein